MSVKLRITLVTALLLLVVSIVVSIYTLRAQQKELYLESRKRVTLALSMLAEMTERPLSNDDRAALWDIADGAARGQPQRVCVADRHGIVLADSEHKLYDRTLPAVRDVARTGKTQIARTDDLLGGAAPVRDYQGRLSGIVYVSFSARPMDEANAQVIRKVVIFALCLTGFGAIVAYLLGFYFSAALTPLLAAIRRTADRDYQTSVRRTGVSELDEIGLAFDRMTGLVGSEMQNLETLNRLAQDLMAAKTLEQFADLLGAACRTLVDGSASLLVGDPRMGVLELAGAEPPKRRVTNEHAAFLAVNERRPVSIGEDQDLPRDTQIAADMTFGSGVVAPLITPDQDAIGVLAVEFTARDRSLPDRQDETTVMAVANLAAPILATLVRTGTQEKAMTALSEILLPEKLPQPEGLEIYADFRAAEVSSGLGGDYYDVFALGADTWGIAIGDVSGKGLDAGRYTAMTKYVVRSFAMEYRSPAETLSHTDEALSSQMEEMRFVTLFYGIVDVKHRTLSYCCAGHLPGLLYRAASDDVAELSAGGGLVGSTMPGTTAEFGQETIDLAPGDTLLLYTDGIIEARSGNEEYGPQRLTAVLRANARRSLKNIAAAVMNDVCDFAQNLLRDDVTMVLLRLADESGEKTTVLGGAE